MANSAWIELCGITLSGTHVPDADVIFNELVGWGGVTEGRGDTDPIPGGHGSFRRATKVLRSERPISIGGWVLAGDRSGLLAKLAQMEAAFADAGEMTVSDGGGAWSRWVEVDSFRVDDSRAGHQASFTIDLVAPDPRRYGPLLTVGPVGMPTSTGGVRLPHRFPWNFGSTTDAARLFVENAGLVDLSPAFSITGGFSRVTVRDIATGARMRLDREVHDGETLVLDARMRRASIGASEVTRWMTARQWPLIGPGKTHEFRFEVDGRVGDPLMTAQFRIGAP